MSDEINDQAGKEESVKDTSSRQTDGNVPPVAEAAAPPEEEPVGSHRAEQRPVRKMSAADFKIRPEPKPEPPPAAKEPAPEPIQPSAEAQPAQAQHSSGIPSSMPAEPIPEEAPAETASAAEQPGEPGPEYHEPVYEPPKYEYAEPVKEAPAQPPRPEPKRDSGASGISGGLKAAFSFFTIFPINVEGRDVNAMTRNMHIIPVVGFVIGIIATIVGMIFFELQAGAMIWIAVLATTYIISKFLHLDGLVDFGDGMICSGNREKSINALKDTRIGAGGLGIALIAVLAIYAGISGITETFLFAMVIVIMEVFAKNTMVVTAAFGEVGTGMASEQVRNTGMNTMLFSTIISAVLAFAGYLIMALVTTGVVGVSGLWTATPMITAALMIVGGAGSSFAVGWLLANLSNRKFGFVNGDVLGASNEISKIMFLFIAFIILGFYTFT